MQLCKLTTELCVLCAVKVYYSNDHITIGTLPDPPLPARVGYYITTCCTKQLQTVWLHSDDQCPLLTYCGDFCCPGQKGAGPRCCLNELSCCGENDTFAAPAQPNFCGSSLVSCPNSLSTTEVYDDNNELRIECCKYFRTGCCSNSENNTLDLL